MENSRLVDVLRHIPELPPTLAFLAILGIGLLLAMVKLNAQLASMLWALLFAMIVLSGTIAGQLGGGRTGERIVPRPDTSGAGREATERARADHPVATP